MAKNSVILFAKSCHAFITSTYNVLGSKNTKTIFYEILTNTDDRIKLGVDGC